MLRQAASTALSLILMASLALALWSLWQMRQNPALRPFVDRGADQIVAATDRWLATNATAPAVEARLDALLAAEDRNWLAIRAVEGVAVDQALVLSAAYHQRRDALWDSDSGWLARSGDCLICAVNAASCDLSGILICQAPMVLTPLGDLAGVGVETFHWAVGSDVDQLNLAFSAVGLGAEAALALTGGSSALVNGAEALGPRTVRRLELMGKSRFLRATLRASDTLAALGWGVLGLIWAFPSLVAGTVQHALLRGAKRGLWQGKKRR